MLTGTAVIEHPVHDIIGAVAVAGNFFEILSEIHQQLISFLIAFRFDDFLSNLN